MTARRPLGASLLEGSVLRRHGCECLVDTRGYDADGTHKQ